MAIVLMSGTVSLAILWISSLSSWVHIDAANFEEYSQQVGFDELTSAADHSPHLERSEAGFKGKIPKYLDDSFHTSTSHPLSLLMILELASPA